MQDIPSIVQTLEDGSLVLAVVIRPLAVSGKGKLRLVRIDTNANPMYHKTIELDNVSIFNIGGIFQTGTNELIVFATFDTTAPTFNYSPTQIGAIYTDTAFNFISHFMLDVPCRPGADVCWIDEIRAKPFRENEFMLRFNMDDFLPDNRRPYVFNAVFNYSTKQTEIIPDTIRTYTNIERTINTLNNTTTFSSDFLYIKEHDGIMYFDVFFHSGGGDLDFLNLKDSIHHFINSAERMKDFGLGPYERFSRRTGNHLRLYKNKLLIAGPGIYDSHFGRYIDTLYRLMPIQSAIALLPLDSHLIMHEYSDPFYAPYPKYFTFVEDIRAAYTDSGTITFGLFGGPYSSAFTQNIDYRDENKIYYGRQLGSVRRRNVVGYIPDFSVLMIAQFDSTLNKVWDRHFKVEHNEGIVSVNATNDGGVILVTRKGVGQLSDPNFRGLLVAFDFAVYKLNEKGVMTAYKKVEPNVPQQTYTLYPNPAKDYVKINGDSPIHAVQVWDSQGKQYHTIFNTTRQEINTSHLTVGVYYIQLFNSQNEILQVLKLVKE